MLYNIVKVTEPKAQVTLWVSNRKDQEGGYGQKILHDSDSLSLLTHAHNTRFQSDPSRSRHQDRMTYLRNVLQTYLLRGNGDRLGGQQDLDAGMPEGRERRRKGGWMDVFYSAVHSKESLVRPWEVGCGDTVTTGGCVESHQAKVACLSCPHLPRTGLPQYPRRAQSLAESSPRNAWPQHKLADEFAQLTIWSPHSVMLPAIGNLKSSFSWHTRTISDETYHFKHILG